MYPPPPRRYRRGLRRNHRRPEASQASASASRGIGSMSGRHSRSYRPRAPALRHARADTQRHHGLVGGSRPEQLARAASVGLLSLSQGGIPRAASGVPHVSPTGSAAERNRSRRRQAAVASMTIYLLALFFKLWLNIPGDPSYHRQGPLRQARCSRRRDQCACLHTFRAGPSHRTDMRPQGDLP
jgi:hypothetical protein